jgi:hypothetical protein
MGQAANLGPLTIGLNILFCSPDKPFSYGYDGSLEVTTMFYMYQHKFLTILIKMKFTVTIRKLKKTNT